jgi:hypothetical protein
MCVCSVLSTDFTFKSAKPVDVILESSLGRKSIHIALNQIPQPASATETRHPSNSALYTIDVDSSAVLVTPVGSGVFRKNERLQRRKEGKLRAIQRKQVSD